MSLCSHCRSRTATTDDGRCGVCPSATAAGPGVPPAPYPQSPVPTPDSQSPAPVPDPQTPVAYPQAPASVPSPAPPRAAHAVFRPPVGLGRAVMILLGVVVLTDIASIVSTLFLRSLFAPMVESSFAFFAVEEAERVDRFMYITTSFQMMAFLATAVVFIIWFHRARVNASALAPDLFTRGPGWAIGSWFIPVAFLWMPYGVAAQTWKASRTYPHADEGQEPRTPLKLWWAGFLLSLMVARLAGRRYEEAESPQEIVSAADLLVVSDAVDIVAALLAIHFVYRLTGMQRARAAERMPFATGPGHPAPTTG